MLTQKRLKELLSYDPDTGEFRWRMTLNNRAPSGSVSGYVNHHGYVRIMIDKKTYQAHRLAWLYVYGEFVPELDHKNGVRSDNSISNLRPATRSQNLGNSRKPSTNRSGKKGVSWNESRQKWRADIQHNGRHIWLGRFDTSEAAHAAYCKAARELFGEFAQTS